MEKRYTTLLSIAGSDSSGGAGIQADIKTCCALGVYSLTAVTTITAQHSRGITECFPIPHGILKAQLEAITSDIIPDAVKIGVISDKDSISTVSEWIIRHKIKNVVVDPVVISTSGYDMTTGDTITYLKKYLFPLTTIITPNIPEIEQLTSYKIDTLLGLPDSQIINSLGCNVLIKGGHSDTPDYCRDILICTDGSKTAFSHARINSLNTHGTGCSLSTAIGCYLAIGYTIHESVEKAIEWTGVAIEEGRTVRHVCSNGPINHIFKNAIYKQINNEDNN